MVYESKFKLKNFYQKEIEKIRNQAYEDLKDLDDPKSYIHDYFDTDKLKHHSKLIDIIELLNDTLGKLEHNYE